MVMEFMLSTLKRKGKKMLLIFMKAFFVMTISKEWLYNGMKVLYILEDSRIIFISHKNNQLYFIQMGTYIWEELFEEKNMAKVNTFSPEIDQINSLSINLLGKLLIINN